MTVTPPNPENVPADVATEQADMAKQRTDNINLYADAEAAVTALNAANNTITSLTNQLAAANATIATLEAELNPPTPVPPAAPTNVTAVAGVQSATVTWTASAATTSPVTTYAVVASETLSVLNTTTTSCVVTGLIAGTPVSFTVTANSAAGPSPSATSNTVTPTAPVVTPPPPPPTTAIVNVPANPTTLLMCTTQETGIHYLPNPTITMGGTPVASGQSGNPAAVVGTSWQVIDHNGIVVGSGSMAATSTTFTVCSGGTWVGGATATEGFFTVVASNGATGSVAINNANSHMWRPPVKGATENAIGAYIGNENRDQYSVPQALYTVYPNAQAAATAIIATVKADPYFGAGGAPLDPARPRSVWIASSTQATSPTQGPTSAYWGQLAAALVAGGLPGCTFGAPTNEPENGGWSISAIITYWQACAAAILAADPTAKVMGYCSGGIYNNSPIANVASFLSACGKQLSAFDNHMENSYQNMGDTVALRQYFGGIKAQFVASGYPNLPLWLTENGIEGGQYGVLQPQRQARAEVMLRLVAESFGWQANQSYSFLTFDHQGANLPMYQIDKLFQGNAGGNMRAGAQATHVLNDALWGTTCTPEQPPAALNFGPPGSIGDSLFFGLHYTGTINDVVALVNNGLPNPSVTLNVSATDTVKVWDGMGAESTVVPVWNPGGTSGQITVPLNNIATYVFLPPGSTVSVVDTDQGVVAASQTAPLAISGSFAANNSGIPGVPTPTSRPLPASDTLTFPEPTVVHGFAFKGPAPAWQTDGSSVITYNVAADGVTVLSFTDLTAVSYAIPSPSNANSSDPCTRTSWWACTYSAAERFPTPITCSTLKVTVTNTGYGGQPDLAASTNATAKYHEGDPQAWVVSGLAAF